VNSNTQARECSIIALVPFEKDDKRHVTANKKFAIMEFVIYSEQEVKEPTTF